MKYRRDRKRGGAVPPFVDAVFAEALGGRSAGGSSRGNARREQKGRQLCRQVERAVGMALAGECGDDVLREVYVAGVAVGAGAGTLIVRVVVPSGVSVVEVLGRLERVGPRLRGIVARAVTRKRVPELVFVPVASFGEGVGHE